MGNKTGNVPSEEHRKNLSAALKKYYANHEHHWKGCRHSEETKKKIGIKSQGRKPSQIAKNKNRVAHLGTHHITLEETKRKISIAKKGRKHSSVTRERIKQGIRGKIRKGPNCNFWRGGLMADYPELEQVRKSNEYNIWRKGVLERDLWTCQKTGTKVLPLCVHHINSFRNNPEIRLSVNNGITLSKDVHIEFHNIYGTLTNKSQLEEYLCQKIT